MQKVGLVVVVASKIRPRHRRNMRGTSLGNEITGLRSTDTGTYKTEKVGRKKVLVMGYSILREHGPRVSAYVLPLQSYSTPPTIAWRKCVPLTAKLCSRANTFLGPEDSGESGRRFVICTDAVKLIPRLLASNDRNYQWTLRAKLVSTPSS